MGCVESSRRGGESCSESCNKGAVLVNDVDVAVDPPVSWQRQPSIPRDTHSDLLTTEERAVLKADWARLSRVNHQHLGMRIFLAAYSISRFGLMAKPNGLFAEPSLDSL